MRLVTVDGRALLLREETVFDVATISEGRLPSDPIALLADHWDDLTSLAKADGLGGGRPLAEVELASPIPRPRLVLSMIANAPPASGIFPMIVGKAPSAVVGPTHDVVLPDPRGLPLGRSFVILEPELAVVTRATGRHLSVSEAEAAIAGYCVAQDITERVHEFGPASSPWTWENLPAKTLGKSIDTFCPLGPALVTPDELARPADLRERCWINGEAYSDRTYADMLWSPAQLVSLLTCFMSLEAGTVLLCGAGGRTGGGAPRQIQPGDVIVTEISGIGRMENRCVAEEFEGRPWS